jgi:hypothetical protein
MLKVQKVTELRAFTVPYGTGIYYTQYNTNLHFPLLQC